MFSTGEVAELRIQLTAAKTPGTVMGRGTELLEQEGQNKNKKPKEPQAEVHTVAP